MTNRKQIRHQKIVDYWINWEILHKETAPFGDWDWEEAACMACGWFSFKRDTVWEDLERCHIIPVYKGGSSEPENFVLMCRDCHALDPEYTDPQKTFAWMRARAGSWMRHNAERQGIKL